jgi:hypothetical protein
MDDNERSSDTAETFGSQSPPSGVSNQNSEEESAPHGDGEGRRTKHRDGSDEGNPGGAGEGSQATGHPQNAG